MKVRIEINVAGIGELLKSGELRSALMARQTRVLEAARSSAPVETGAYQSSLHIEQVTLDRAVVRVVADSEDALEVEARTGNLARAFGAAGGA